MQTAKNRITIVNVTVYLRDEFDFSRRQWQNGHSNQEKNVLVHTHTYRIAVIELINNIVQLIIMLQKLHPLIHMFVESRMNE